jgi:hypothetical protein
MWGQECDVPQGLHTSNGFRDDENFDTDSGDCISRVKVSGVIWPASLVRAQLGNRANELQALMMPAAFPAVTEPGESSNDRQCSQPQWSEFVSSKSTGAAPVRTLRFELAQVRTIDIQSDIDGLAGRISAT